MSTYPQIDDKLILFGQFGANHVASINWGPGINNTERHHFLTLGYQRSLEILLEKALNITDGNYFEMDLLISPIIFSLRHFIELSLKDTIRTFNIALRINKSDEIGFNRTHDLMELFSDIKTILSTYKSRFDLDMSEEELTQNLFATENILKELNNYDQYSFSFRYPFKSDSKSSGKIHESLPPMNIDLVNLKEVSTRLIAILGYLNSEADRFETKVWLKEKGVK